MDFRDYYHLESYLFDTVRLRFKERGFLDAYDFLCIVIWKANRAKSNIAKKLLRVDEDLNRGAAALTYGISQQSNGKDRLHFLWEADFDLPMASAILTVLYPDEFTVYDKRVCDMLGGFHSLKNLSNFDSLWLGYQDYKRKVEESTPGELSLRDRDRYLWGKSFYEQLLRDIERGFRKA